MTLEDARRLGIRRVRRPYWHVQVLHRFNEAIALDYVVPFRVITPMPKGGAADAASQDRIFWRLPWEDYVILDLRGED